MLINCQFIKVNDSVSVWVDSIPAAEDVGNSSSVPEPAAPQSNVPAASALPAATTLSVLPSTSAPQPVSGGTSTTLSDGTIVNYERARLFMEFYCNRFKFGTPDIEYNNVSVSKSATGQGRSRKKIKIANSRVWEAIMTVGGRKIGVGSSLTKKAAEVQCYLDVAQYLEQCDPPLWNDFVEATKNDPAGVIGLAPHLVFQISDGLNDDIYGLCQDIRQSTLFQNAPNSGATTDQSLTSWNSIYHTVLAPNQLAAKSQVLKKRLNDYRTDPKLTAMRAQRESLPVYSKAAETLRTIAANDVTVVMAATGSGKTTQIPQMLLDEAIDRGQGATCNILCTQPRRLAAQSVAERIADERGSRLGAQVGYQVRFDAKFPESNGSIMFCTTGIFLKRMQSSLGQEASHASVHTGCV